MESDQTETNKMALTSASSAGVAWVIGGLGTCGSFFLPPPFSLFSICAGIVFVIGNLAAAITGYLGRNQIRDSGGAQTGAGLAMTGLVLGGIGTVLTICIICIVPVLIFGGAALFGPAIDNIFSNVLEGI